MAKQTLYAAGLSHATALLKEGKISRTETWSAPSADAQNSYIEEHGLTAFAKWHLGRNEGASEGKGEYEFPFSNDFKTVNLKALADAQSRASQAGYADIAEKAKEICRKARKSAEDTEKLSRTFVGRMQKSEFLRGAAAVKGCSVNDLTCKVACKLNSVPALMVSDAPYSCGPYICDILAPERGDSWSAIVQGRNGKLYEQKFTVEDDEVMFDGEPSEIMSTHGYEYVEQEKNRALAASDALYRYSTVETIERTSGSNRFQVAFASEYPVKRRATKKDVEWGVAEKEGEVYYEVLSHKDGDYDFSALNNNGAFLDEHDTKVQIGAVRKARVSKKDLRSRGAVEFDEASEISKTRKQQYEKGIRTSVSVGYVHTDFLGEETIDGTKVKRFSWAADEISSVAIPADPSAGINRAKEGAWTRDSESDGETGICIGCGSTFDKAGLDDDFQCEDCRCDPMRTKSNPIDSKKRTKDNTMAQLTEAELLAQAEPLIKNAVTVAVTEQRKKFNEDRQARNKEIHDRVKAFVDDHGKKHTKTETCATVLRGIENEFLQRDSTVPTETLLQELGQRCLAEIVKFPNHNFEEEVSEADLNRYSLANALKSCVRKKEHQPEASFELDIHQQMVKFANETRSGVPYNLAEGFLVPAHAPTPARRAGKFRSNLLRRMASGDRMTRDLTAGTFNAGGALVPTELKVPIIELLRNRTVLDWTGCTMLGGLEGNIIIPRQTSACAPQALAEIATLTQTSQTFDQISARPSRIGNQQFYSRLLVLQSSPDVEAIIREDNFRQTALLVDEYGLNGTGGGSQPLGVINTPGISSITFGGSATLSSIITFETDIRAANVNDPIAYVTTSTSAGRLKYIAAALSGSTVISGASNALWIGDALEGEMASGHPAFASQQIPNNIMVAGAWEHLVWFSWGGINVVMDYITQAKNDEIGITLNSYHDFALRHPVAFVASTDGANQ